MVTEGKIHLGNGFEFETEQGIPNNRVRISKVQLYIKISVGFLKFLNILFCRWKNYSPSVTHGKQGKVEKWRTFHRL